MKRTYLASLAFGLLGGLMVVGGFAFYGSTHRSGLNQSPEENGWARYAKLTNNYASANAISFVEASATATPAVVHIKSIMGGRSARNMPEDMFFGPFRDFFGDGGGPGNSGPGQSSGSGVIISDDGYIVTNNHVIEDADKIEVVLNDNRSYTGTVVGADPSTDLAVVKINEGQLPHLRFADSDKVQVGEWVLAVGNPFNLTSTVTAGIVSAKGRSIGILADKYRVESFIQTDAAVNPGNSGGALINTSGELVGVNTAIATRTGSFSGYSFAVPANLAKKVVDDLLKYGEVQRGFLGVSIETVTSELAERKDLSVTKGVLIQSINEGSAAADAGLKADDVIVEVDNVKVASGPELQEQISRHRPGDTVILTVLRNGDRKTVPVKLKNKSGSTSIVSKGSRTGSEKLGADFEEITGKDKDEYRISHGVKVKAVYAGKLRSAGVQENFIITHIDKTPVYSPKDVDYLLKNKDGAVLIEGINENGGKQAFAVVF